MISPERPGSPTFLYRFDVIVDPAIGDGTAFIGNLELLQESLEPRHDEGDSGRKEKWEKERVEVN